MEIKFKIILILNLYRIIKNVIYFLILSEKYKFFSFFINIYFWQNINKIIIIIKKVITIIKKITIIIKEITIIIKRIIINYIFFLYIFDLKILFKLIFLLNLY